MFLTIMSHRRPHSDSLAVFVGKVTKKKPNGKMFSAVFRQFFGKILKGGGTIKRYGIDGL